MGDRYSLRVAPTIELDKNKDADMISNIEYLKSRRKLGEYTSALFKVASNNKEVAKLVKEEFEGVPNTRDEFFDGIEKNIDGCKKNINRVLEEIVELKSAIKLHGMSGSVGLEGKVDNTSLVAITIDSHLNKLKADLYGLEGVRGTRFALYNTKIDELIDGVVESLSYLVIRGGGSISNKENIPNNDNNNNDREYNKVESNVRYNDDLIGNNSIVGMSNDIIDVNTESSSDVIDDKEGSKGDISSIMAMCGLGGM